MVEIKGGIIVSEDTHSAGGCACGCEFGGNNLQADSGGFIRGGCGCSCPGSESQMTYAAARIKVG